MSEDAAGVRLAIPMLVCRDVAAQIEFCRRAFGAAELHRRPDSDGGVLHATLSAGEALIMLHAVVDNLASRAPADDGASPVVVYIYVADCDAVVARAVDAGARVLLPAADAFWGDRVARVVDPAGHVWNIASRDWSKTP
jgi:PhnB protein